MAHITGVDILHDKRVVISPTYIYGIGDTTAKKVLANVDVSEDVCARDLTDGQTGAIRAEINKLKVEGDLRREVSLNIRRLIGIGSYHEIRHRYGLPTHGQNTRNNARTRKGPAKTVVGKKK